MEGHAEPEPTKADVVKADRVRSSPRRWVDSLIDARAKLDELIGTFCEDGERTRENSLSPEEYLGIQEAKDLALRAAVHPLTPPSGSSLPSSFGPRPSGVKTSIEASPSDPIDNSPPLALASKLATDFHSADGSGRKAIRTQAKQGKITAAFEQEVRRVGALAREQA